MKKIFPLLLLLGICFSTSVKAFDVDSCSVTVWQDSIFLPDSIVLYADGLGTPPFTYEWSTGDTGNPIIVWDTIEYCVTITDADGCVASGCVTPYVYHPCYGYVNQVNNGTGVIYNGVVGGEPPFQYFWSTGETSASITPTQAGEYCFYAIDNSGCQTSNYCVNYNGPSQDSCWTQITSVPIANNGANLWASPSGSWPFSYTWSDGSTDNYLNVFTDGTYCVSVVDAGGCLAVDCYEHILTVQDSCVATISALPSNINSGVDLCAYSTGPGPYTYLWSTGESGWIINVVNEGNYCVTVVDANGCEASTCYYYDGINTNDSCSVYFISQVDSFGILIDAVASGTPPFTYLWDPYGFTTPGVYVNDPGNYCVTIEDANGCISNACFYYAGNSTNDSCSISFTTQTDSLGILIVADPDGTPPFTYLWNPYGFTTSGIYVYDAGSYCVTVEDADGCVSTACYYYAGNTNPDSCVAYISALPAVSNDGEDLCAYSTGPGPYTYLWSTGQTNWLINVVDEGNYCVTVVDGNGCEASSCYYYTGIITTDSCSVFIGGDSLGFTNGIIYGGSYSGNAPFTYLWSTGETTQYIQVLVEGPYCVTITDSDSCQADYCVYAYPPSNTDSCSVEIFYIDSILTNGLYLYTNPIGVGPFTYEWSTGDSTPYLVVDVAGNYCLTVTNGFGCSASDCFDYIPGNFCSVYIYEDTSGTGPILVADTPSNGPTPFTYVWSTGETTQQITPLANGTYCVTLTNGDGCTATECYYFNNSPNVNSFCGVVYLPDSLELIGSTTVSLYRLENGGTTFVEDQYFAGESGEWWFSFDNLADGDYIVKAAIDAGATAGADYVPTYFHHAILWVDADVISLPSTNSNSCYILVMVPDGNVAGTGNGAIGGNVGDLYGALGGITILLYDEFGNLIDHVYTDANGEYNFYNLPLGNYQIVIEYTGFNHAEYWVTLTEDTPRVLGLDFDVDNGMITTGTFELASSTSLKVFPNPVSDQMTIQLDQSWDKEVNVKILNLEGKVIAFLNQELNNDVLVISAIDWESGMYFLQINDGRQMASGKVVKQ